ncbi:hypothetical protein FHS29_000680 [Saccharothrix tamanrassetensis]|uniref:Uncharacterized protein n=1 Tax=Saccharothrix tamanrassetensis TaxID=1051531 RepID=A0A841CAU9_9PSEU|nr:DUF6191 domain-containing protein [Saccharothrix tamanrassetensis]MBB5954110.1 hypothetical protein [Saccharothrix tamanrassetensis]
MGVIFAMSIPGLAVLLFGLAAGERIWQAVRRRRGHSVVTQAGMDEFTMILYGSKVLELDQRRTEVMLRDEEEDGAPPRGPIDLDSGSVRLTPKAARPE